MADEATDRRIFFELSDPGHLVDLARREAARSQARGRDGRSPAAFATEVTLLAPKLSAALRDGTYRFMPYRQVLASKGAGRVPRLISVPAARDRGALKVLVRFLHQAVPESRPVLAQQVIRDLSSAIASGGYKYFVRIDIENFYPSISHKSAKAAITRFVGPPEVQKALFSALATPTLKLSASSKSVVSEHGVPQGLAVSNSLAELVMQDLDDTWNAREDLAYFRYVDDILILTRRKKHRAVYGEIEAALRPLGLKCHELQSVGSKSTWGRLEHAVDYLGYAVAVDSTSVRQETVTRLKEKLAHRFIRYRKALSERPSGVSGEEWLVRCQVRLKWYLDLTIAGCILDEHRRGWIHYFALMDDFALLRELDFFVAKKLSSTSPAVTAPIKTFISAYRRAARVRSDETGYVPNFDKFTSDQQRETLRDIFLFSEDQLGGMSDSAVSEWFFRRVRRELDTLETDLAIAY